MLTPPVRWNQQNPKCVKFHRSNDLDLQQINEMAGKKRKGREEKERGRGDNYYKLKETWDLD